MTAPRSSRSSRSSSMLRRHSWWWWGISAGLLLARHPIVEAWLCPDNLVARQRQHTYNRADGWRGRSAAQGQGQPPFVTRSSHNAHNQHNEAKEDCRDENDDDFDNDDSATADLLAGPSLSFERTFPRYRIDLRSVPADSDSNSNNPIQQAWSSVASSWGESWQAPARREALMRRYPTAFLDYQPNLVEGVAAWAALWRTAATLLVDHPISSTSTTSKDSIVVAPAEILLVLPKASPRVLIHFVDILAWGLAALPLLSGDKNNATETTRLHAEYLPEHQAVHFRREGRRIATTTTTTTSTDTTWQPDEINQHTQAWVQRVLVKLGICPFTKSATRSGQGLAHVGVPVGGIAYHASAASHNVVALQADTWEAIAAMLAADASDVSSILLAAPAYDHDVGAWAGPIFAMLEAGVVAARAESTVGVVCFHPLYATPDGTTWPGFGHMHSVPRLTQWVTNERDEALKQEVKQEAKRKRKGDTLLTPTAAIPPPLTRDEIAAGGAWQRRTPHATINVLRADQLAAAEGSRDSASLYPHNIRVCLGQGNEQLQADLDRERGCPMKS